MVRPVLHHMFSKEARWRGVAPSEAAHVVWSPSNVVRPSCYVGAYTNGNRQ